MNGAMTERGISPKEDRGRLLARLAEIGERFGLDSLDPLVRACRQGPGADGVVEIAVLGRFKAGKSSFLNCIAGCDVLPVGAVPVTSVITVLCFGETERARVVFADGLEEDVPVGLLADFVTEEGNPRNRKNVSRVRVDLPSLRRYPGIRFLDTPGLGSAFRHNTQVTREWLPRAAASLVAISADQPLSEQDVDLLGDLARHTPRIALLLTKVDLLSDDDLEAVIRHVRASLGAGPAPDLPLFPFSCRSRPDHWREQIESGLFLPLASRGGEVGEAILSHKVRTLVREQRQYLQVAWEAAVAHDSLREDLKGRILDERVRLSAVREEIRLVAGKLREDLRAGIEERILAHRAGLLRDTREALGTEAATWRGNLWRLTRRYEKWAEEHFARELSRVSDAEKEGILERLREVRVRVERIVEGFKGRLAENVRSVLGVELERSAVSLEGRPPPLPPTWCGRVFDSHLDIVWFLIPTAVFGPLIRRHFLHHVGFEAEKNLYRLSAAWRESTGAEISRLAAQAEEAVRRELETLETLLGKTAAEAPGIREVIDELAGYLDGSP